MELSVFTWFGVIGGFLINIVALLELRNVDPSLRPDLTDVFYWLPYFFWPIIGGVLAFAHEASQPENVELGLMLGINIGASAPLMIRAMMEAVPEISRG